MREGIKIQEKQVKNVAESIEYIYISLNHMPTSVAAKGKYGRVLVEGEYRHFGTVANHLQLAPYCASCTFIHHSNNLDNQTEEETESYAAAFLYLLIAF